MSHVLEQDPQQKSVPDLIAIMVVIDWLDHRFPEWHLAAGKPVLLIRDGEFVRANLDRQLITEDEVLSQLRMHGLESPRPVRKAYVEGDGQFTFLLRGGAAARKPPEKRSSQA